MKKAYKLSRPGLPVHVRHLIPDLIVMTLSWYISMYLRVGYEMFPHYLPAATNYLPLVLLIQTLVFTITGVYRTIWRYVTALDAFQLTRASLIALGIVSLSSFFVTEDLGTVPRTVYMINALLGTLALMGLRLLRRLSHEHRTGRLNQLGKRVLIYGAGNNGRTLAYRFKSDGNVGAHLVGFIDDSPANQGMIIAGSKVLGTRANLARILVDKEISQIIIAIPNLPGNITREVLEVATKHKVELRITSHLLRNSSSAQHRSLDIYRELELKDLLQRPPKQIDLTATRELIEGKRVLITGAGGSIGSELSRQILDLNPSRLLILDHSEYNLYEVDNELKARVQSPEQLVPLLMDIKDEASLRKTFETYAPQIVFHAAAYKHVHLVEANPQSAVLNNVLGTQNLLRLSEAHDIETFVLISTDKAVNPGGVMGATKRVCELLTTISALRTGRRYCSVRFGNVLGSSGSLIPLLKKQIAHNGPVTITHPDMTRFFMLIPEAVSLVLQAAVIAKPGHINVLKMGDPVKITEIAKSMISLMGKTDDEVPIIFTGLRPGEKMFEELYIRGDELMTEHPDILTLPHGDSELGRNLVLHAEVVELIEQLLEASSHSGEATLKILNQIIKNVSITKESGGPSFSPNISLTRQEAVLSPVSSKLPH